MSAADDRSAIDENRSADGGAAVADFALVAGILTLVFASVLQLALVMHVRNTVIDCAGAGARYASLADLDTSDGVARTKLLLTRSLNSGYARHVSGRYTTVGGVRTVEIRVSAPLPVLGLLGPPESLTLAGHAVADEP